MDEQQRIYRILTTRWDLTDQEIMEIYKQRWMIELFFKWVKQHLKLTKIWSTKPQGIWNQMFLSLIAYGLSLIVKLQTKSTKTLWEFFQMLQIYLYKTWNSFIKALNRKKTKTSRGRQKIPIPLEKKPIVFGTVAICKEKRKK
ncbi:transposase [Neobacillus sp. LXY-4]|uniref:transposase n=1 Tax=Neobacillus sp. LXY-4 TaxID=3379826 RepID=UPI003EE025C8